MPAKKIYIIGAGPGGLAAAMLLAGNGYQVEVFEKQPYLGGRTSALKRDGYTFDRGPTFLSMPYILSELFESVGINMNDYLQLIELDPMYQLKFPEYSFFPSRNIELTYQQIKSLFPGNEEGYIRFMRDTEKKMNVLMPILQNRHSSLLDYGRWRTLRALPSLSLHQSLYQVLSSYFQDENLKIGFTFQSKYLGMSPWECPGAFSILSFMEHKYGVFHPRGGLNQIPEALAKVTREFGGKIHLNTGVKKILTNNRVVKGIELDNGEKLACDELIINADFAHAMTTLLDDELKHYSKNKLEKKEYSCSTFMIYAGVKKEFELPHHTIVFSRDYKKNVEEITKTKTMSDDPSIYIQNGSATDSSLAPKGKSSMYLLAPVPNNFSLLDWEEHKEEFRDLVYEQIETKTDFKNLRSYVETEEIITPLDWENNHAVYKGATFNLSHRLKQMMYYRPHNQFQELKHCWLVGGGTHPGSGLPTIFESARITANLLMDADKGVRRIK
ncbi:phytoene desaturase family protein [Halalkalibacter akibai]|uniref:Phytoene dehydrogenase n=1 Tax=Halalkalibacter akibai (strain ATCC 43226 / DSM 21942 / CIP 109018 / JCM 9157 / 1139) TaxID=1236973 RepID=W4QN62_HALA3|nr:phytoene desaturase family protein [Halalkalibacter akibai]GAE33540.1 phytoene dehydrogenase [Halalkalibacter akibai JCM 9157]